MYLHYQRIKTSGRERFGVEARICHFQANCLLLRALIDGFFRFAPCVHFSREIILNSCTGICIRQNQQPQPTPPSPRTLTSPHHHTPHASSDHHLHSHIRTLLFGNNYQGEKNSRTISDGVVSDGGLSACESAR